MSNTEYQDAWKDGNTEANANSTPAGATEQVGGEKSAQKSVMPDAVPGKDEYVSAHEELAAKEQEKPMDNSPIERATDAISRLQAAFENAKKGNAKHFSHEGKTYSTEDGKEGAHSAQASAPQQHQEGQTAEASAEVKRD